MGSIDSVNYPHRVTPTFTFVKRSTTGYSLNGKENLVAQGASYAMTDDTTVAATMESGFIGTSMAILAGINGSTATTNYGKATEKAVNTGWAPKDNDVLDSDILTLWGMTDLGTDKTDTYVLSMTYKPGHSEHLGNGGFGIATKDADGNWVNAVDKVGGTPNFVKGPWKEGYRSRHLRRRREHQDRLGGHRLRWQLRSRQWDRARSRTPEIIRWLLL